MTTTATHYIEVNAPADRCYRWWRPLTHLPEIMSDVRRVEPKDGHADVTKWVVDGPLGRPVEWEAKIVDEERDRKIAWASLDTGSNDIDTGGAVRFDNHGDTTGVEVSLHINPPAGALGEAAVALFHDPQEKIENALAEFKRLIEADTGVAR
ncbi:hypothetical protein PP1_030880 [Pseudonocardia sp. P1]